MPIEIKITGKKSAEIVQPNGKVFKSRDGKKQRITVKVEEEKDGEGN